MESQNNLVNGFVKYLKKKCYIIIIFLFLCPIIKEFDTIMLERLG